MTQFTIHAYILHLRGPFQLSSPKLHRDVINNTGGLLRAKSPADVSPFKSALLIALAFGLVYLSVSVAWILYSDQLAAELATDRGTLIIIQQHKGLAFVTLMAMLISWLAFKVYYRGAVLARALNLVRTDALTGLANRMVAEEYLDMRLKKAAHSNWTCGVLLFDIRGLKRVNLSVGRSSGDQLLHMVGQRIHQTARPIDLVAHLESDRFVIILGALSSEHEALGLSEKLQVAFAHPFLIDGVEIQIELRGGAALAPRDGKTPFALLDAAERALNRAKQSGHELSVAREEDLQINVDYLELEGLLRRAIRERQFTIELQPQVDLNTFEVVGAEALVRWNCPGRGKVSPAEFIPLAESLNLIQEVTEQVLTAVGDCSARWRKKSYRPIQLSVNLSGLDLRSNRILTMVESVLNSSDMSGHQLTFEITESWLMEDISMALGLVHRLRSMGSKIAIDDFGTGFSAFSQLIDFPYDYIKFDRYFISGADKSAKKAQILTAMQRMASTLGAKITAEGVETVGELLLLVELGIDEAQGYLFSKALTREQFEFKFLDSEYPVFQDLEAKATKHKVNGRSQVARIGRS